MFYMCSNDCTSRSWVSGGKGWWGFEGVTLGNYFCVYPSLTVRKRISSQLSIQTYGKVIHSWANSRANYSKIAIIHTHLTKTHLPTSPTFFLGFGRTERSKRGERVPLIQSFPWCFCWCLLSKAEIKNIILFTYMVSNRQLYYRISNYHFIILCSKITKWFISY